MDYKLLGGGIEKGAPHFLEITGARLEMLSLHKRSCCAPDVVASDNLDLLDALPD